MAMSRLKAKGRRESGRYAIVPHDIISSPNFQKMNGNAVKLLLQLMEQLRFKKGAGPSNNGDLCVSWSVMKNKGWRSKNTLQRAKDELLYYGFIQLTRQGLGVIRGWPNLYALTFHAIDECDGKLEVPATRVASGRWKEEKPLYESPRKTLAPIKPSDPTDKTSTDSKR